MKQLLVGAALAATVFAATADETADDARYHALIGELRCLVCQNQTLADSSAELAGDLRRQVREQVAAGRSDDEVIEFLVQRYGDFVRYEPPFKATTALLWIGPFALLVAAAGILFLTLRRRRNAPEAPALGADEKRVVERVLGPAEPDERPHGDSR